MCEFMAISPELCSYIFLTCSCVIWETVGIFAGALLFTIGFTCAKSSIKYDFMIEMVKKIQIKDVFKLVLSVY